MTDINLIRQRQSTISLALWGDPEDATAAKSKLKSLDWEDIMRAVNGCPPHVVALAATPHRLQELCEELAELRELAEQVKIADDAVIEAVAEVGPCSAPFPDAITLQSALDAEQAKAAALANTLQIISAMCHQAVAGQSYSLTGLYEFVNRLAQVAERSLSGIVADNLVPLTTSSDGEIPQELLNALYSFREAKLAWTSQPEGLSGGARIELWDTFNGAERTLMQELGDWTRSVGRDGNGQA